jgi:hypothetical protein
MTRSKYSDLRKIFDESLSAIHLAEPLLSFDESADSESTLKFMEAHSFDIVGVRKDGLIEGYIHKQSIGTGAIGQNIQGFSSDNIAEGRLSILATIQKLLGSDFVVLTLLAQPVGIVTKADLGKTLVSVWLYGLLSLLEINLLELIRSTFIDDSWTKQLTKDRLDDARRILDLLRRSNAEVNLANCLEFADKKTIVAKTPALRSTLGFPSRNKCEDFFSEIIALRDQIAHAQDLSRWKKGWIDVFRCASEVERLLRICEEDHEVSSVSDQLIPTQGFEEEEQ